MIHAGKLRKLVTIQRLSGARDTTGAETLTWNTFATVWAAVEPYFESSRAGREEFSGAQLQAIAYTRIRLRYLAGVTPKDQVKYGTRVFDIMAVNNKDERNAEMELLCKERQ